MLASALPSRPQPRILLLQSSGFSTQRLPAAGSLHCLLLADLSGVYLGSGQHRLPALASLLALWDRHLLPISQMSKQVQRAARASPPRPGGEGPPAPECQAGVRVLGSALFIHPVTGAMAAGTDLRAYAGHLAHLALLVWRGQI